MVGWEDLYAVSDRGRVLSLRLQRILAHRPSKKGYLCVVLSRDGHRVRRRIHVLMLEAFVGPRPPGHHGCHWDDDKTNNTLVNLRWDTPKGNGSDQSRNNTHCPSGHEYTEQNTYHFTRKDGRREKHCRKCRRDRWHAKHGKTDRRNRTKYSQPSDQKD